MLTQISATHMVSLDHNILKRGLQNAAYILLLQLTQGEYEMISFEKIKHAVISINSCLTTSLHQ